jgi:uncharacterized protein YceK
MTATQPFALSASPRPPRRPSRWWLALIALTGFLLAPLTGCSSTIAHGMSGPGEPYAGTQLSAEVIRRTGRAPFLGIAAMLDLPATFVADTCLLPLDAALN